MTERLSFALGTSNGVVRTKRKLIRSVTFKLSANAMAPPSPILLPQSCILVMVAFAFWYFHTVLASAWLHAGFAERIHSCAARDLHTWASVRSDCSAWMPLFPVSLWARSVSKCCADEAMCNHTTVGHDAACRAIAWCLLCAWSCSLVFWQDTRSHVV